MTWQATFLDFDGVVLESTSVKTESFGELFESYGLDVKSQVVQLHLRNRGLSRHEKFKMIYRDILDKTINEGIISDLAASFSDRVFKKLLKCSFVEGVQGFLERALTENHPVYVLSAAPQGELEQIIEHKNLRPYFQGVYGIPMTKVEAGRTILGQNRYDPKSVRFVGDSLHDYDAAMALNVVFIGRWVNEDPHAFPKGVEVIRDFRGLL